AQSAPSASMGVRKNSPRQRWGKPFTNPPPRSSGGPGATYRRLPRQHVTSWAAIRLSTCWASAWTLTTQPPAPGARSPRALNRLRATWESAHRGDSHDRPRRRVRTGHQTGAWRASGFLDLDLLLLLRHLCRLWQVDVQYALIELRLDLRRIGIKRQGKRSAKRAIAALHHVPVLVLVLFIARALFFTADGQQPVSECYVEILLIDARQLCCHFNRVLTLSNIDLRRSHVRPELRERASL